MLTSKRSSVLTSRGVNKGKCQEVHVCLIGHDWPAYACLKTEQKKQFLAEFEIRYLAWATETMRPKLGVELTNFTHSHLRLEFFFLPFTSVNDFRGLFLDRL